jgi:hypothetical protein
MMRRHTDILEVLQSVAFIVKRRHALPITANVLSRRTASIGFMDLDIGPLVLDQFATAPRSSPCAHLRWLSSSRLLH